MVSATDGSNYPMRGAGVVGPDGNQGAGKPSDTTMARITAQPPYLPPDTLLCRLHDCTIHHQEYWKFYLLAFVRLVAVTVLAAAALRTLG